MTEEDFQRKWEEEEEEWIHSLEIWRLKALIARAADALDSEVGAISPDFDMCDELVKELRRENP